MDFSEYFPLSRYKTDIGINFEKVLIIGGCGYIGTHLGKFLQDEFDVSSVDLEWYGNHGVDQKYIKRL